MFFFNDTATTEIYTLSLHDALPILRLEAQVPQLRVGRVVVVLLELDARVGEVVDRDLHPELLGRALGDLGQLHQDRKSTRLNSSHANISYAVFCLKKKKSHYR